ncbi:sensor histidine kinase [Allostreptomyces psammosilenae]|uniref:histidine kinase n=1 Tax=Allostreptomyces psammosilenae TaxID=1892865 RepID=A0A852ZW55_9ACTN|nr:sensor histidine kinase [Allostreptomyces psammosilenae]NYI06449.1 signal transduction histidine kinase [Allostreptomyces psammosilenae]
MDVRRPGAADDRTDAAAGGAGAVARAAVGAGGSGAGVGACVPGGERLSRRRLVALDGLAAAGYLAVFSLLPIRQTPPLVAGSPPVELAAWGEFAVMAAMAAPLAARRLWPRSVFAVVLAASLLSVYLGVVRDSFVAAAFALYPVAVAPRGDRPRVPTRVVGGFAAAGLVGMAVAGPATPFGWAAYTVAQLVVGVVALAAAWTVGSAVRERRAHAARSAEQLASRAVAEERLRIARELHDVVAHSMSVITVKAAIGNHVFAARPEEARDALRVIETTSRQALTEMRAMLGVLRATGGAGGAGGTGGGVAGGAPDTSDPARGAPDGPEPADLAPSPGLAGLPALAERAAMVGVRVGLEVSGADGLPEGLELAVYRIVQEAVTNVVRHAAPASCRVVVRGDGSGVRIEVTDDGPGTRLLPAAAGHEQEPGHGLIGMRERVMMYGGDFSAGPGPRGGFRVRAHLPYAAPKAGTEAGTNAAVSVTTAGGDDG